MFIDLHSHTTFSDGLMRVEELVKKAKKKQLKLLALTDHDSINGLPLFLKLCAKEGLQGLPGIEMSTELQGQELHILGYNFDYSSPALLTVLHGQQKKRMERARIIIGRFQKIGLQFDKKTLQHLFNQPNVGKPQLGRAILGNKNNQKILKDKFNFEGGLSSFIGKFIDQPGQFGYVAKKKLDSLHAIDLIKKSGGVAVLAHPDLELFNRGRAKYFIKILAQGGLWGLENPHNRKKAQGFFQNLAKHYKLVLTFGSDTHDIKRLGVKVTNSDGEKILKALCSSKK